MFYEKQHIVVIDPAVLRPELEAFNQIATLSNNPLTYHLPAMHGLHSLERAEKNIKGIIIFGSNSSVNERADWQKTLENWLMPHLLKKVPTLGICYGHQMIAHMFGGKVEYAFPDKKKNMGFRSVELLPSRLWQNKNLKGELYVSHNEIVVKVPDCMRVVIKSEAYAHDGLEHKELPIFTFQPHPETTCLRFKEAEAKTANKPRLKFGHELVKCFLDFCSSPH